MHFYQEVIGAAASIATLARAKVSAVEALSPNLFLLLAKVAGCYFRDRLSMESILVHFLQGVYYLVDFRVHFFYFPHRQVAPVLVKVDFAN